MGTRFLDITRNNAAIASFLPVAQGQATLFDGSSDSAQWAGLPTGLSATGPEVCFSTWLRLDSSGIFQGVWGTPSSANIYVLIRSLNTVHLQVADTAGGFLINHVNVGPTNLADGNPHHIAFSLSRTAARRQFYIDGVARHNDAYPTANDVAIHASGPDMGLVTGFRIHGAYWETWFDDTSPDISGTVFRTAGGAPADLGDDGSTPTGSQPVIYLPDGNPADNKGTGGAAVVTGAPTLIPRPR